MKIPYAISDFEDIRLTSNEYLVLIDIEYNNDLDANYFDSFHDKIVAIL